MATPRSSGDGDGLGPERVLPPQDGLADGATARRVTPESSKLVPIEPGGGTAGGKVSLEPSRWCSENGCLRREVASLDEAGDWKSITPLQVVRIPPHFPTQALPTWCRRFAEAVAIETQTPVDLAAMLVLGVLSTVFAKRYKLRVRAGWFEPLVLQLLLILASGNRKSAAFNKAFAPAITYEFEERARLAEEIATATAVKAALAARVKQAEQALAEADDEQSRNACKAELLQLVKEHRNLKVPIAPRRLTEDVTPEKLVGLLFAHHGRIAVVSSEGGPFEVMAGRYSSAPNFEVYLKGHSGDPIWVDRMTRQEQIQRPAVVLVVTAQPDVLRGLARPGFRGRGALARLSYAVPTSMIGSREIAPEPVPPGVVSDYEGKISALLSRPEEADDNGELVSKVLTLEPLAHAEFTEFERALEPRLKPEEGDLGPINDWGGKLAGNVARIAGLLHLAEHAADPTPETHAVTVETVRSAILIGDYLVPHAQIAFDYMGTDQVHDAAIFLANWIEREGHQSVTRRDLYRAGRQFFKGARDSDPTIDLLIDHGYLRPLRPSRRSSGRPSTVFAVNPKLWSPDDKKVTPPS
jgi:hypothetical protein